MRTVIVFIIAILVGGLTSVAAAFGGFILLVALNGFSESTGTAVLAAYGIGVLLVVAGLSLVVARIGMGKGNWLKVGLAAAFTSLLVLGTSGFIATWDGPTTSGGGKTCKNGRKPIDIGSGNVECKHTCETDDDCQSSTHQCTSGGLLVNTDDSRGDRVKYCKFK